MLSLGSLQLNIQLPCISSTRRRNPIFNSKQASLCNISTEDMGNFVMDGLDETWSDPFLEEQDMKNIRPRMPHRVGLITVM